MTDPASQPNPTAARTAAAVVDPSDTDAPSYGMFELSRLAADGAFLSGPIFFEQGEEFTVEITSGDRSPLRVRAKVVGHERAPQPGMSVTFQGLTAAERRALDELATG